MVDRRKLRLNLESTVDSVEAAELIVQRMAELNGFDQDQVYQIGIGVREAVANAVMHGNRRCQEKTVVFDALIDENAFTVIVEDQGAGFAPDRVRDPLAQENLLECTGRGLLLMRAYFDTVEVTPCDGSGTRVRLVKHRTECAGGATQEESQ